MDRNRRYVSEFRLQKNSNFICNGNFRLMQGAAVFVASGATLKINGNSFINTNSTLNCFNYIEIGNGVVISDNVEILDSDNHSIDGKEDLKSAPIIIEDNVWIGKNSIILKGVKIGCGSIIGAGSIVTKDVPPHSIAVGNPIRVIKKVQAWN